MQELSDLKSTYKSQCDAFIERLSKLNNQLNQEVDVLTRHCNQIDRSLSEHDRRISDNETTMSKVLVKFQRA